MAESNPSVSERTITSKILAALNQFPHYLLALRLIWETSQKRTSIWGILMAAQGLLPVATVYLTRSFVDNLVAAIEVGFTWDVLRPVVILAALMGSVYLISELMQGAIDWIRTANAEYIQDHITAMIHEKSSTVDLAFYESPDYYDHLHRARSEASSRSLSLLESTGSFFQNGITLLAMAGVLIPYGAWLPVVLLVSTLPALYIVSLYNKRYHNWWEQTTTERRWAQYHDLLLTSAAVAAELRVFDLGEHFQDSYNSIRQKLRLERLDLAREQNLAKLAAGGLGILITGLTMVWMVWRSLQGLFTLGDLALFYQAFSRGQSLMRTLLGNVGNIYANSLFLGNLFAFLGLESRVTNPANPVDKPKKIFQGIEFRRITFRYPGSERTILNNFSLTFPAGKITAIVGPNGAGKSTLVKLLCRFYDPESGHIKLDCRDIREFSITDIRKSISVLFQLPVPYYTTAGQNIAFGDLSISSGIEPIEAAARSAGAHEIISRLPHGYETLLGKLFAGGAELSVGEWQRVALARSFLRQAQILILDEPTSFMDSWAESDWLENFRDLAEGKTAILITHRFTTARYADIIHVMNSGEIIESGSHEELLCQGGMYAQSWKNQVESHLPSEGQPNKVSYS